MAGDDAPLPDLRGTDPAPGRKPEQSACTTDFYAKDVVPVKNINRKWHGMPQLICPANGVVVW
jgi:hypothetical protein